MTCVGACLLLVGIACAQNKTYTVREGDSLSVIAERVGAKRADIARYNKLSNVHKLKPGMRLRIPTVAHSAKSSKRGYAVRKGDNDRSIAARLRIPVGQLRAANPGVDWSS